VSRGFVWLVGAGPGDPGLLTRKAHRCLREAEVVFHDGLVPAAIVRIARFARRVSVARRAGPKDLSQEQVIAQLVAEARAGRRVVRLKAGDPFVLGRGREEVEALLAAGISHDVVPGLTSAIAAPTLAGIPLTLRKVASSFVVLSGHSPAAYSPILRSMPPDAATVVVLMGMRERRAIAACLVEAGWRPSTPVAIITDASRPRQRVWAGVLEDVSAGIDHASSEAPGVIVVGQVAGCAKGTYA
jgi:uroporphyrin-III C-methyltransferase